MDDLRPREQELLDSTPQGVLTPHAGGFKLCGHCHSSAVWEISSAMLTENATWRDFECDLHAKQWWPDLFHSEKSHATDQEMVDCDIRFPPLPRCDCGNPRSPQMDLCPDCHSARLDRESPRIP